MVESIKLAFEATVITMLFLGIMAMLISRIKQKNICPICGDPCRGKFCCEACDLLHFSEEEFSRKEEVYADEDENEAEFEMMEREERKSKCIP